MKYSIFHCVLCSFIHYFIWFQMACKTILFLFLFFDFRLTFTFVQLVYQKPCTCTTLVITIEGEFNMFLFNMVLSA